MKKIALLALFILATSSCSSQQNDFDTMCSYFDGLSAESSIEKLTSIERFSYLNELVIANLAIDSVARESWNAVVAFEPVEGRYSLFKAAAEETLGKDWSCKSMDEILGTV